MTKMEIIPGKSVGNILFGMDEESVVKLLGEPDFMEVFSEDSSEMTRVFSYFDKGLTLYFDEEDVFLLGCMEIDSYDFYLFGQNIARLSQNDFKKFLSENDVHDLYEENDEHQEALVSDSLSASFYFEFDALISVQIGVFVDDEEKPLWPEDLKR